MKKAIGYPMAFLLYVVKDRKKEPPQLRSGSFFVRYTKTNFYSLTKKYPKDKIFKVL